MKNFSDAVKELFRLSYPKFFLSLYSLLFSIVEIHSFSPKETQNSDSISTQLVSGQSVKKPYMVTGETIVGLLKNLVDFKVDGANIVFHRGTGKLFVKQTPNNQLLIRQIIQKMRHYKPKQILIEARIIEVNSFEGLNIGVDWSKVNLSKTSGDTKHTFEGKMKHAQGDWGSVTLNPLSQLSLMYGFLKGGTNNLSIMLNSLEKEGKVNTLSSPKIICFNNQRANIRVEQSTDYVSKIKTTTVFTNNNSNVNSSVDVQSAVEGIVMDVTPTIDREGKRITLDLHPVVVELVSLEAVDLGDSGVIRVPKYLRRSADTTLNVEDGGTVVLGGLMKRTKSTRMSKVPILGSIPLIKYLFRRKTTFEKKSNLIIFITAKIIDF